MRHAKLIVIAVGTAFVILAAAVAIITMAAGTRSTASATASSGPPTASPYSTPAELQQALEAHHITCGNYTVVTGRPVLAISDARCHNEGGKEVVLRIYANHVDAESQSALLSKAAEGTNVQFDLLVGDNWTISCDNVQWLNRASTYLGGHIVHVSG